MNKKIIIISASLFIFILFDVVFILPSQFSQIRKAHKETVEMKSKIVSLEKDLSSKEKFIRQEKELLRQVKDSQGRIVLEEDASFIMAEINRISKGLNLRIISIQPKPLRRKAKRGQAEFYYLPFAVRLSSGYHNLAGFLNRVEGLDFSLVLKEISVQGEYPDMEIILELCGVVKK
jgi:Tfp pilus assembly protein PilO